MIQMNCTIHAIKLATVVVFLIKPLFYMWYIRKRHQINWRIVEKDEPIKQKWHGIAQHISAVVLEGTDSIVLTLFSTLSNVSVYSVYYMIIINIHGFYQSFIAGIQSAAGAVWAKRDRKEIERLFATVEVCLHAITVFLFSCTGILIVPFVTVYTNGLTDANYIQPLFATILVLAYGVRCLRTPYNIWILAAGHFKQTQRCHIIAATMNLGISVLTVSQWGLVGIAIGTLIAMCYQTTWMMIYTTKKLMNHSSAHVMKRLLADAVSVVLIYGITFKFSLDEVSYLSWFIMAIKVSAVALVCTVCVIFAFYPKKTCRNIKQIFLKVVRKQIV